MALFHRIARTEGFVKIPVHQFSAALREYIRGRVTRAQIIAAFNLAASDLPGLDTFLTRIDGATAAQKIAIGSAIDDVCMLAEGRQVYSTETEWNTRVGLI